MMESEWQNKTPFNGFMYYYEDVTNGIEYKMTSKIQVNNVIMWYFYKGYTIGEMKEDSMKNRYFIGDENSQKLHFFSNKIDF